jgi:hypothetical protein
MLRCSARRTAEQRQAGLPEGWKWTCKRSFGWVYNQPLRSLPSPPGAFIGEDRPNVPATIPRRLGGPWDTGTG